MSTEKINIQIGNDVVELIGEELEIFLIARKNYEDEQNRIKTAEQEKTNQKLSAINKLKELGLTQDEAQALLG